MRSPSHSMTPSSTLTHNSKAGILISFQKSSINSGDPTYVAPGPLRRTQSLTITEIVHGSLLDTSIKDAVKLEVEQECVKQYVTSSDDKPNLRSENGEASPEEMQQISPSGLRKSDSMAAQQRRIIKLTDKVLLLRTQMLHQQAIVETCRTFLTSSIENLNSAIVLWRSGASLRRQKKRRKAEKNDLSVDQNCHHDTDASAARLQTFLPESSDLEKNPSGHPSNGKSMPSFDNTSTADPAIDFNLSLEQYHGDCLRQIEEDTKLKKAMDDLSIHEYELSQLLQRLYSNLRSGEYLRDLQTGLDDLDIDSPYSSRAASRVDSETPSLVEEYFDQKGDAGVYRERLQELEYFYHEGLLERALILDRGDPLDVSDEDFQEAHDVRRKALLEDIQVAEEKAATLAVKCRNAGLDIDKYRREIPSVQAASTAGLTHSVSGKYLVADNYSVAAFSAGVAISRPNAANKSSSLVDKWLRNVPSGSETDPGVNANDIAADPDPPDTLVRAQDTTLQANRHDSREEQELPEEGIDKHRDIYLN